MADAQFETELKLRIDEGAANRVLGHPALTKVKQSRARRSQLSSTYFDTPDARLAGKGVAVRLRRAGTRWLQAVKGPATTQSGGGLAQRVECEWMIGRSSRRPPLDLALLAATPYRRAIEKAARHAPLAPVFVTDFQRTTIPLRFDDATTATLCLDQGFLLGGTTRRRGVPREAISEIELELQSGDPLRLFDLALALSEDLPIAVQTRSKAEQGYALVAPGRAEPVRAEPLSYAGDAPAGEAIAAILRNCVRQIEANAHGLLVLEDPEWVHQMRVGVRRLRSALLLARSVHAPGAIDTLAAELRWLARALASARDLDVFTRETLPSIVAATKALPAFEDSVAGAMPAFARQAKAWGRRARQEACAAVASPRLTRILLTAGRLAATPSSVVEQPASEFAAACLKQRLRKVLRAGDALEGSAEQRHTLRVAAKKLRYTAEFFVPLFAAKRARAFRNALACLQEDLGRANDDAIASMLAAKLAPPPSPVAALVAGWALARAGTHAQSLARSWRNFRDAKPFWTRA